MVVVEHLGDYPAVSKSLTWREIDSLQEAAQPTNYSDFVVHRSDFLTAWREFGRENMYLARFPLKTDPNIPAEVHLDKCKSNYYRLIHLLGNSFNSAMIESDWNVNVWDRQWSRMEIPPWA